jgi:hypothetical protein
MKNGERNWLAIERIKNKDLMSRREVQQKARDAVEFQKDAVKVRSHGGSRRKSAGSGRKHRVIQMNVNRRFGGEKTENSRVIKIYNK